MFTMIVKLTMHNVKNYLSHSGFEDMELTEKKCLMLKRENMKATHHKFLIRACGIGRTFLYENT